MRSRDTETLVVPEIRVYDARRDQDVILTNVAVDSDYVRDVHGRVMYFDVDEGQSHLAKEAKTMPSLPLLVNLYVALSGLADSNEVATNVLAQLGSAWDRTSTAISPGGTIVHSDGVLGEVSYEGLTVPVKGEAITELFPDNRLFFQALLGVRDIECLTEVAAGNDLLPFYWHPRGERRAMFGGGDFYYMHQYIPGLLMVFCDDEPHPRRTLRGVWREQ